MMDSEEHKEEGRDVECNIRPTVNPNMGTFSIESILKSGAFRCPSEPEFPAFRSSMGVMGGLVEPVTVKREEPRDVQMGSTNLETATCHDDSGDQL